MYFNNLTAITQHASTARTWPVYYQTLHALGGLGVSTITKLAYFHGHQFGGCPALILDSRLVKVLADGHWRGLTMLNLRYQNAVQHYQDYLDLLSGVATQLGCPPDHIEFLLFSWGDSFC
jgi:hypothetical protein